MEKALTRALSSVESLRTLWQKSDWLVEALHARRGRQDESIQLPAHIVLLEQ